MTMTIMMMGDLVRNLVPALIEGMAVAIVAFLIPGRLSLGEVASIGITAASTMIMLDRFAPSVGKHVRHGAGFGIGAKLVTV